MEQNKDKFILKRFMVGALETNCYLVADPLTRDACLIDPGGDAGRIKKVLDKEGLKLKFIINTHGHGDHIACNGNFSVPVYIHRLDKDFLTDPDKNLSSSFLFRLRSPEASRLLEDGGKIKLGELEFEVIHTPGHTPGSISLKLDNILFTGDTLFQQGVGRTDLAYGDEKALFHSIKERLFIFNDDTVIYPGHGGQSTIGEEKRGNPFIS